MPLVTSEYSHAPVPGFSFRISAKLDRRAHGPMVLDKRSMYGKDAPMHTVRMTLNVDESLLKEVVEAHPGVTKTALVEQGLRALLARDASERLAAAGGTAKRARRPKRSVWGRR